MNYINFCVADSRSDDFMAASLHEKGVLFSLLLYCAEQENGGIIRDCIAWPESHWQRAAGIGRDDVKHTSTLWKWSGNNLIIPLYNHKHESGHKAKRLAATITNQKRWGMRSVSASKSKQSSLSESHSESLTVSQRKGKKRKESAPARPNGAEYAKHEKASASSTNGAAA